MVDIKALQEKQRLEKLAKLKAASVAETALTTLAPTPGTQSLVAQTQAKQLEAEESRPPQPSKEDYTGALGQMDFQERLNAFDRLVMADVGITELKLDAMRNHASQISQELHRTPELDSLVLDRDVRNIIAFIRMTRTEAVAVREEKKAKVAKKAAKLTSKPKLDIDISALQTLLGKIG